MPFTRAQATALLNKAEMGLFDDSRANALKKLDATGLARRIERARASRDRARDLLKRQKLAARARTGSKSGASGEAAQRSARKAELLAELLSRFQEAKRGAPRPTASRKPAKKATARKPPAKTVTKKTAAKKATKTAAAKQTAVKKANATKKAATKTATTKKASRTKTAVKKSTRKVAKKPAKAISPRQALANTRKLLEAKQQHDREPQPWQALDPQVQHVPQPGYQSGQAEGKAQELHAGESRMASIHGSMGARDRRNQGKRDHRGDTD